MCRVLLINRRCYCAWFKTPHSARALDNMALLGEIKQFYAASGNIYGGPRICRDRKAAGLACSETLRGYSKTRYKAGKSAIDAPNRLRQVFVAIRPDVVWVTDITQIYIH
jgi:putative transposase